MNELCLKCQGVDVRHHFQIPPPVNWNIANISPLSIQVIDDEWDGGDEPIDACLFSLQPCLVASREESRARMWTIEQPWIPWMRNSDCDVLVTFGTNASTKVERLN